MSGTTSQPSVRREARPLAAVIARVVRLVVGIGVLVVGIAIAAMLVATRPQVPRVTRSAPVLQVRTMEAVETQVPRTWEGFGTVRAMRVAQIPAQVSGLVVERPGAVEAGFAIVGRDLGEVGPGIELGAGGSGPVEAGTIDPGAYLRALRDAASDGLILQIEASDYLSRLSSALELVESTRAQLASLDVQESRTAEMVALAIQEREIQEREVERVVGALAQGGGNESEIERRRGLLLLAQRNETNLLDQLDRIGPRRAELNATVREQWAAAEVARQNLARTVVTSPISGVLQEVMYRPGDWAQAGTTIARVVDLSRVEVPLKLPQSAGSAVGVGDEAELRSDTHGGSTWRGRVVRLAPEADAQTRTLTVYVEVEQQEAVAGTDGAAVLRPGQFVIGQVRSSRIERVVLVPRHAVEEDSIYVAAPAEDVAGTAVMVARRIGVQVLFSVVGARSELDPVESQWLAIRPTAGPETGLRVGSTIIVSNLDDLHDGLLIGVNGAAGGHDAHATTATPAGNGGSDAATGDVR